MTGNHKKSIKTKIFTKLQSVIRNDLQKTKNNCSVNNVLSTKFYKNLKENILQLNKTFENIH